MAVLKPRWAIILAIKLPPNIITQANKFQGQPSFEVIIIIRCGVTYEYFVSHFLFLLFLR